MNKPKRVPHGHATNGISPTYHSWAGMTARCTNEGHRNYALYGGRGITVCDRWLSFPNFLADMGEKPRGLSLDRIDGNGNYEPSNCRWATATEQARNRSNTRTLTLNGETRPLAEWAERTGIHPATLSDRVHHGWTDERALTEPVNPAGRRPTTTLTVDGRTHSLSEWARISGIPLSTVHYRVRHGFAPADVIAHR